MIQGISNLARYAVFVGKVKPFMLGPTCANSAVASCVERHLAADSGVAYMAVRKIDKDAFWGYADSLALSQKVSYISIDYLALQERFHVFGSLRTQRAGRNSSLRGSVAQVTRLELVRLR